MIDVKTANVLYLEGKKEEAVKMYLEGAEQGDAECAFNYAYCLFTGNGIQRDTALAKSFFVFAKERVFEAAYNLAVMYLTGTGVKRDYMRAMEYMNDAARGEIIEAQLYLGIAHTIGSVFEPDVTLISKIPYHTAEYRSDLFLLEGDASFDEEDEEKRIRAVRLDHRAAFEWFRIAARHNSDYVEDMARKSKYLYARCFIDGLGTDFNRDKGNALMLLAASEGSDEAMYYLNTEAPYVLENLTNKEFLENVRKLERLG